MTTTKEAYPSVTLTFKRASPGASWIEECEAVKICPTCNHTPSADKHETIRTMCYTTFRAFFDIPNAVKRIYVTISKDLALLSNDNHIVGMVNAAVYDKTIHIYSKKNKSQIGTNYRNNKLDSFAGPVAVWLEYEEVEKPKPVAPEIPAVPVVTAAAVE